jgi:hypothetical protein
MWICPKCATHFKEEPYVCPRCGPEAPLPAPVNEPKHVLPSVRTFLRTNERFLDRLRKWRLVQFFLAEYFPLSGLATLLLGPSCALLCLCCPFRTSEHPSLIEYGRWFLLLAVTCVLAAAGIRAIFVKPPMRHGIGPPNLQIPTAAPGQESADPNTQIMTDKRPGDRPSDGSITTKTDEEGYTP